LESWLWHNVGGLRFTAASLYVQLNNGRTMLAKIDPNLRGRVLMTISYKELGQLVAAVEEAVENLPEVNLCRMWPADEA